MIKSCQLHDIAFRKKNVTAKSSTLKIRVELFWRLLIKQSVPLTHCTSIAKIYFFSCNTMPYTSTITQNNDHRIVASNHHKTLKITSINPGLVPNHISISNFFLKHFWHLRKFSPPCSFNCHFDHSRGGHMRGGYARRMAGCMLTLLYKRPSKLLLY